MNSEVKIEDMIFVFGSNRAGRHGAGAAKYALQQRGAMYGRGEGRMGTSYALPTKNHKIRNMARAQIGIHVERFIEFAKDMPHLHFQVTRIGCGLAGHTDHSMAKLFLSAPRNCHFDTAWKPFLGEERFYWGHVG